MISFHRGRFVVVHLYSTFSVDPPEFSITGKFVGKITIFTILEAISAYF